MQTNGQTNRENRHTDGQTDRKTDRQKDRLTDRQTDRQIYSRHAVILKSPCLAFCWHCTTKGCNSVSYCTNRLWKKLDYDLRNIYEPLTINEYINKVNKTWHKASLSKVNSSLKEAMQWKYVDNFIKSSYNVSSITTSFLLIPFKHADILNLWRPKKNIQYSQSSVQQI